MSQRQGATKMSNINQSVRLDRATLWKLAFPMESDSVGHTQCRMSSVTLHLACVDSEMCQKQVQKELHPQFNKQTQCKIAVKLHA